MKTLYIDMASMLQRAGHSETQPISCVGIVCGSECPAFHPERKCLVIQGRMDKLTNEERMAWSLRIIENSEFVPSLRGMDTE